MAKAWVWTQRTKTEVVAGDVFVLAAQAIAFRSMHNAGGFDIVG